MKKLITLILFAVTLSASAQKPDTTRLIPFHQNELIAILDRLNKAAGHIDAIPNITNGARNKSDTLIYPVLQFIQRRLMSVADSGKKTKTGKP